MQRLVVVVTGVLITFASARAWAVCLDGAADGLVAPSEGCDDGNTISGDGCSATCEIEGEYACTRAVTFARLSVQDFPGTIAAWVPAVDNLSAQQQINTTRPTVALFGEDAAKGTYSVRLQVETTEDDDFIGLVLGFHPGDQNNPNASYLVLDWKQIFQDGVPQGLRLAHVRGVPDPADHNGNGIALRTCANPSSCVTQLANARTLGATGWADNTPYTMQVTYRPDLLSLIVNGTVELVVRPSDFPGQFAGNVFPPGQMGFYGLSQERVRYTNLASNGPSTCNLTSLADSVREITPGTPSVIVDVSGLLSDVGDALAPRTVAVTKVTGGLGNVSISSSGAITFTPANPNLEAIYQLSLFACDDDEVIADCDTSLVTLNYDPDSDGDGIPNLYDLDDDNDGIPDTAEKGKDSDGDGMSDDRDLDSDNDGLPDLAESGIGAVDINRDGIIDCTGSFGINGLCDALETAPDSGIARTPPVDVDSDGVTDFRDVDSDNDGIGDRMENGTACGDSPVNGVCDGGDLDLDGSPASADGKVGLGVLAYPLPPDRDGDGTPDYRDLDSDGDNIPDVVETNAGATDLDEDGRVDGGDADGDGLRDAVDDSDGDGIVDARDADAPAFGGARPMVDTDGDGLPDARDLDSDNDTLPDVAESGPNPHRPVDSDSDGVPDFQDPDSDNDGIGDGSDNCSIAANPDQIDQGGDGLGDVCDPDDNDDGFEDAISIAGGGCAVESPAGGALAGPLTLFAAALLLARRRRPRT